MLTTTALKQLQMIDFTLFKIVQKLAVNYDSSANVSGECIYDQGVSWTSVFQ